MSSRACALVLVCSIGGASCVMGPSFQPLEVRDFAVTPEFRVSKTFSEAPDNAATIEVGTAFAQGNDKVTLAGGQARLDGVTFTAPQNLAVKSRLSLVDVTARWRQSIGDAPYSFELFGGADYANLRLNASSASSPAQAGAESVTAPAFHLGAGGILRLATRTSLEARATVYGARHFDSFYRLDVSIRQTLNPHFAVHGGYAKWHIETPGEARSKINIDLSGLSVGVGVKF